MPPMYISSICFYKKNDAYSKFSINSAAKSSALKQSSVSSTNTISYIYIYIYTHTHTSFYFWGGWGGGDGPPLPYCRSVPV